MGAVLREMLESHKAATPSGELLPLDSHVPPLDLEALQAWRRLSESKRLLEVGLAYGVSTLALCDTIDDWNGVRYDVVDKAQSRRWQSAGLFALERAGYLDRVTFHEQPSEVCLPRLAREGLRIDFAFVDGDHSYQGVRGDFESIDAMLDLGGVVVFDDVQISSVASVLAEIDADSRYQPLEPPAAVLSRTLARARRMAGLPALRLRAYRKLDDSW